MQSADWVAFVIGRNLAIYGIFYGGAVDVSVHCNNDWPLNIKITSVGITFDTGVERGIGFNQPATVWAGRANDPNVQFKKAPHFSTHAFDDLNDVDL